MWSARNQAFQDIRSLTPEQQKTLIKGGLIGAGGVLGSVGSAATFGAIDNFAGEDTAADSGEFLANGLLVGAVPIGAGLGNVAGGLTYRLPADKANEATVDISANRIPELRRINSVNHHGPIAPDRFLRRGVGTAIGGVVTALGVNHYMTEDMRGQSSDSTAVPQGITSNIPMQQLQEISDLLGANGAY